MKVWPTLCNLLLCLTSCVALAQSTLWHHFDTDSVDLRPLRLSPAQIVVLKSLFRSHPNRVNPDCKAEPDSWMDRMAYYRVPLTSEPVMLVVGQAECTISGAPASSADNWLITWSGSRPHFLTQAAFGCWLDRIQPHVSRGFHDFTMGCHQSSWATDYYWYRFDGKVYRVISSAIAYSNDGEGRERMAEDSQPCRTRRQECTTRIFYSAPKGS